MTTEVRVPTLGESVTEATIASWFKQPGEAVSVDEMLCELETDKVTVEVPAPVSGVLTEIVANEGDTVEVNALLAQIDESATASAGAAKKAQAASAGGASAAAAQSAEPTPAPAAASAPARSDVEDAPAPAAASAPARSDVEDAPSAKKLMEENGLDRSQVSGSGRDGRVMKGDVLAALEKGVSEPSSAPAPKPAARAPGAPEDAAREKRVRMTRLRQTIARRLKDAQNTAAMLTTYNEVDMSGIMALRNQYKDDFAKKHGVKLGFMSFFVKACVNALHEVPEVNAEIDGQDVIYKNYCHVGVAVGTPNGLVVPVIRDAQTLGFADIEKKIGELGVRARDGHLSLSELQGGTFTISNGGVYGSLMSSPILNPPQSGILGMHKIQERPVAIDGKVEIRPMMYLALSYDHRIVDGQGAVTFLVRVKEAIEDPRRLLMDL